MRKSRIKSCPGKSYRLKDNPEVKRVIRTAKKDAQTDGYDYVVYEDEPGSVAYCRTCFGAWDIEDEDRIIVKIVHFYE